MQHSNNLKMLSCIETIESNNVSKLQRNKMQQHYDIPSRLVGISKIVARNCC